MLALTNGTIATSKWDGAVYRYRIQNLLFVTTLVAFTCVLRAHSDSNADQLSVIPAAQSEKPTGKFAYQGVGGCAAMACHHQNGPKGSSRSEYSTWAGSDKHSQAYAVLFDEWAQTIERNYRRLPDLKLAKAYEDQLCLKCHVHPEIATANFSDRFSHNDGVGCENCHGPAEGWLTLHYRSDWKDKPSAEKASLGFRDLKDLNVRSQSCVACHVGAPGMEVDHDLIAAGHPRLAFEFAGYHALMPRHWKETGRNAQPDFEARAWTIGQLTTAKASLTLLADRAARAASSQTSKKQPWPEFAEYDCFACHHDLKSNTKTAQRPQSSRAVGTLPWGDWYFSSATSVFARQSGDSKDISHLLSLRSMLEQPYPDPAGVEKHAKACIEKLNAALESANKANYDQAAVEQIFAELAKSSPVGWPQSTSWDSATQTYLGLAAIHASLHEMKKGFNPELKQSIEQYGKLLDRSFPKLPRGRATSPRDFDFEKARQQREQIDRQRATR